MHLELGTLPIRFVIMKRRILFLHYILQQNKNNLLYKFFEAQLRYPQKGDWVVQVKQDLLEINLDISFELISEMSKTSFKFQLNEAIRKSAFQWLTRKIQDKNKSESNTQAKGSEIKYQYLKLQEYFLPSNMNIKQWNLLFAQRAPMIHVKCNFKNSYSDLTCPVCNDSNYRDSQLHILQCKTLLNGENILVKKQISYNDIYSSDVTKQSTVVQLFEELLSKRRKIEKERNNIQSTLVDPSDPDV